MLQSKLFYKTTKEKSIGEEAISNELLTRAGFVDQLMAGVYTFLPLGLKVLQKIENVIRKNMEDAGSQEVLMPVLQPKDNWLKTGRWNSLDVLFKVKGSGDKEYALGPTHEEVVSPLAKKIILSYRDLPFSVFQIQTKFRDELRAKSGILRTREFLMKDLYSFHAAQADLDKYYDKMINVYFNVFKECGIAKNTYQTLASGGSFSKYSDEFQTITDAGEDIIYICKKCQMAINKEIKNDLPAQAGNPACPKCSNNDFEEKKAVEVGNIFKLGTKYSLPFGLKFRDKDGQEKSVIMGCFGIGLGRLMGAVVEVSHDDKGIIWPKSVAPFLAHLIGVENNKKVKSAADKIYNNLQKNKIDVLYDDRQDKSAGEKFSEADLIGIPYRIVVSEKTLAKNSIELKERNKNKTELVKIKSLIMICRKIR
ncbi:MAG: Prolyl-tRNA synthetase [Parcubacteria group bacterium GW2011_GWA1_36_12]|nr:MAG: Prolyl-tRNA synthetase [Parcubacteria group bacterium GW2011_GWA1_36_12]